MHKGSSAIAINPVWSSSHHCLANHRFCINSLLFGTLFFLFFFVCHFYVFFFFFSFLLLSPIPYYVKPNIPVYRGVLCVEQNDERTKTARTWLCGGVCWQRAAATTPRKIHMAKWLTNRKTSACSVPTVWFIFKFRFLMDAKLQKYDAGMFTPKRIEFLSRCF